MREIDRFSKSDLEYVGEGGFAEVYRTENNKVIKILKDEYLDNEAVKHRFKREFDITKSLKDVEGIVSVYEYCDNDYWYSMELAEMNLYDYLESNSLSDKVKREYVKFVVETVSKVHNRKIIHRDISPQNVLIVDGKLKISDFGLGKDLDVFYSHHTIYTNSYGQLAYCAPEQFMKLKEGNQRSDVYSIGRLINFIMSGHPTDKRHYLRNVCEKAHNENPNMRYQSATEMLESILITFEYKDHENSKQLAIESLEAGTFNEYIENYLLDLSGEEFCDFAIAHQGITRIFDDFISLSDQRAEDYMYMIYQYYDKSTERYEDNDVFADIGNIVLNGKSSYVAKEYAAKLLSEIAWGVGRFDSQGMIRSLISKGIEPTLENLLSN